MQLAAERPPHAASASAPGESGDAADDRAPGAERLAFREVYEAYFDRVCRWARALGGPRSDVEDVAQEVFVVVRRKLDGVEAGNLAGWIYRITAGKVRDARRLAWFRRWLPGSGSDPLSEEPGSAPDPAALLERRQSEQLLYRLLDRLSDKRRRALVMAELEGLDHEAIARLEGIPVATARTRLFHARREFLELAARHLKEHP